MNLKRLAAAMLAPLLVVSATRQQAVPREGFFDSAGVRIRYFEQGNGSPVVLVHGFAITPEMNWRSSGVFDSLALRHRVIAFDLRGHGKSDKPHDERAYGTELANDVLRLMDHLRIQRAHVVGYSLGARIALQLVAAHQDRLLSAVLGGGGWTPAADQLPPGVRLWLSGLESAAKNGTPVSDVIAFPGMELPAEIKALLDQNDPRALVEVLRSADRLSVTERQVRANRVPVLAVLGELDSLAMPDVNRMVGLLPNLEVVKIEGANHVSALGAPLFGQSISRFLRSR